MITMDDIRAAFDGDRENKKIKPNITQAIANETMMDLIPTGKFTSSILWANREIGG